MLELAIKHEARLQELFCNTIFKEEYKFLSGMSYSEKYVADTSTWNKHEFVSVNRAGRVLGYFKYGVDRADETAYGVQVVNFSHKNNMQFSRDMWQFLTDIFEKFKFRKLKFCCIVGNPIEKMYDRYTERFGGRIVGIYKEDSRLFDGVYYDMKIYEVLRKDYLERVEKMREKRSAIKRCCENCKFGECRQEICIDCHGDFSEFWPKGDK